MVRMRVQELAKEKGFNVARLHVEANRHTADTPIAYSTIYALWHNRTQRPDLATLSAVARALGVNVGDLFTVEDTEENDVPGLAVAW